MKLKLLLISLFVCASSAFCQFVATNNIVNTVTWYRTNSPVFAGFYFEAGVDMATNANPQAFTHSIWNYNPANSVFSMRNTAPSGLARITLKEWNGADMGFIGSGVGGTNIVIHASGTLESTIQLTGFGGSAGNEIFFNTLVTTNTKEFVVGTRMTALTNNATVYQAGGVSASTRWSTNVGIGVTNVLVFTNGLYMGEFTIP